ALYNLYGPTETAVDVTCWDVPAGNIDKVVIGKPIANTSVYILNSSDQLVPAGGIGEICIGGIQVARGYLNQAALTAEKFISDPFSNKPGARLYKTGDLGRWLKDGNIEYLGRIDDQVKIRGYRIELGEVSSVLQQCALVRQSVVMAKQIAEEKQLVAYIVPEGVFNKHEITQYLKARLPEYMVPSVFIEMESLPLTSNGKIDGRQLPDPHSFISLKDRYAAPRNEMEQALANIWQQLLKHDRISIYDSFFELGGHSLLVMRLIATLRRELAVELSIRDIFVHSTIAALASHIRTIKKGAVLPSIETLERPARIPLSFAQERLWFIDQLEGSIQYHMPAVLRLNGELNAEVLNKALQEIINRHEVLRTVVLHKEGEAYQQVLDTGLWKLNMISFGTSDQDALHLCIQDLINHPFDLGKDHMLRAHLIKLDEQDHILVVVIHHIAADGWSLSIIVKELVELYAAYMEQRQPVLPALPVQYGDYAIWQRKYISGEMLGKKMAYWKQQLAGVVPLQLPTDLTRPAVQSTKGAVVGVGIDKQFADQIKTLSHQQGVTLYMTLLATLQVLLYRYSGQEDICVGSPITGRQQHETENLIGLFLNTIVLRTQVSGNISFSEILQEVKQTTLSAYEHQEVPFEKIVDALNLKRDMSRSPLFDVKFALNNDTDTETLDLGRNVDLSMRGFEKQTAQIDLSLDITEHINGLQVGLTYCSDLY
ncbi:MAG TPA: condensation domain-containing protein, partial [Chitinophagaceae bacterium]|nr:condensation domain-containing protein [Chitinophagaceae bacterium]